LNPAPQKTAPRRPGLSPRVLAAIVACVALAAIGVGIVTAPSANTGTAMVGGAFALQTGDGKTITDAELKGSPFMVYFGYTHCPDVCPTTLAQISDMLKRLPDKPIKVLFVTVDPERDTPALMADYVSSFDPRIIGLSGSPEAIARMEKAYRVYAHKSPTKDGDYTMDHSSVVYLMDAKGGFIESFNLERPSQEAAKELSSYL
jgi:protein SCO1/2